jgi:hypothetical protein
MVWVALMYKGKFQMRKGGISKKDALSAHPRGFSHPGPL